MDDKNRDELKKMVKAISKWCGWGSDNLQWSGGTVSSRAANETGLNACHGFEKVIMERGLAVRYGEALMRTKHISGSGRFGEEVIAAAAALAAPEQRLRAVYALVQGHPRQQ